MLGIEMVADPATRAPLPRSSDLPAPRGPRSLPARADGAGVRPNLILSPPLVITEAELDYLCDTLEAAFDEAVAAS
jgi:putrescine aminotransferase